MAVNAFSDGLDRSRECLSPQFILASTFQSALGSRQTFAHLRSMTALRTTLPSAFFSKGPQTAQNGHSQLDFAIPEKRSRSTICSRRECLRSISSQERHECRCVAADDVRPVIHSHEETLITYRSVAALRLDKRDADLSCHSLLLRPQIPATTD